MKKKSIDGLIFNACTRWDGKFVFGLFRPAGAHRIATVLRETGYDIEVIDFFNFWNFDELKKLIESRCDHQTIFIGWSLTFYWAENPIFIKNLIAWIRSNFPKINLVAGGTSTLYSQISGLDYYIDGFAERAINDLLEHMKDKTKIIPHEKIPDGGIYINALTNYPAKNFGDLKIVYEKRDHILPEEVLTLEVSRGCVFQCKFCNFPITGKKTNDHIRVFENIRNELLHNYNSHGTTSYILSEETVNDTKYKLEVLLEVVKSLPFKPKFRGFFRVDLMFHDESTIQLLKDINVVGMHFGIETFYHPAGLAIGKGLHPDKIRMTLKKIRQVFGKDLSMLASFIIGLPGETVSSIMSTQDWLENSENPLNSWVWYPLRLSDPDEKGKASYFSKNYEKYDYKILKKTSQYLQAVTWKNPIMDFDEAIELANTLTKRSLPLLEMNHWATASFESLNIDKTHYIGKKYIDINTGIFIRATKKKTKDYKTKKLSLLP